MRELARGKRARIVAVAALAAMLAAGVALGMTQRGDALAADCDALLAARDTLAGGGALNWSARTALAEWDGVTVSGAPPRVAGLDLHARALSGSIPPQLASLTALTNLDLSDNRLTGELPAGLRDLPPTLATLRLAGNTLTGCLDERLRLAATNDLATLKARGLAWCPVVLTSGDGLPLTPGETYQIFRERIIVDIPKTGPRLRIAALVSTDSTWGSGVAYCFSDVNKLKGVCIDGITGEEWSRGSFPPELRDRLRDRRSASGSSSTPTPPAGLDAALDALVASARPAPYADEP